MNALRNTSPQCKLVMWYKCKELFEKGFTKAQICRTTHLDKKTVRRYLRMSCEEFMNSQSYKRMYLRKLDPYEEVVRGWLEMHNDLSSSQIHDWLRERYSNLPKVNPKTVYNFVQHIRTKYEIPKPSEHSQRQYCQVEETEYGEYAQADFGEMWMQYSDGRRKKVYFFVMVLCRSRKKYVLFSLTPFTAAWAVYAHEKAFEYYGGKPHNIIYDQDAILIHNENLGDCLLTKAFQSFINQEHFECIFCRKSDPESKGKVENAVKYVKHNFLKCRAFVNIEQLNTEGLNWLSRTANGLQHNTTKLIPDEVFEQEKDYLIPYYGIPMVPSQPMQEYTIQKTNVITYHSNNYSLPKGSYKGSNSKVWVNQSDNTLEIYDKETGKLIVTHQLSSKKGQYIIDPEHRKGFHISTDKMETQVLEYCNYDELAFQWLVNLKRDKARYYSTNLRVLIKGMRNHSPQTLHKVFEESLDKGMYNAKDLISLCDRRGKRIPQLIDISNIRDGLPDIVKQMPDKTDIKQYQQYFS